jgi:electron transfer flavoprotein beta subunit
MNIVVCVKQVPDTWSEKKLDPGTKTLDREAADPILNEMDEFAIEEALRITEEHGGTVTIVSMGPESATDAIRKALSMGADAGVHVLDDALQGSDSAGTSLALAKAIERLDGVDLVIAGSESSDSRTSVVPAMLAERLGLPQLTFVNKVSLDPGAGTVRVQRITEDGYQVVEASTPAVISVVEKMNEPRYPSFKGIMAAKKKPIDEVTLDDLGLDAGQVGLAGAWTTVVDFADRPPRSAGTVVEDGGDGGVKLVEFLAAGKFV